MCHTCFVCTNQNNCHVDMKLDASERNDTKAHTAFGISYIDYYIPDEKLDIDSFIDQVSADVIPKNFNTKTAYKEFANTILALSSIKVESRLTQSEMLMMLLDQMFGASDIDPLSIDLIMLVSERAPEKENNLAQFLQFKFGMTNSFILNVSGNHCANLEVALSTASKLQSEQINNILILNSTRISSIDDRIIGSYGILGDAAGVMLVSKGPATKLKILDSHVINNGRLHAVNMQQDNSLLHSKYILSSLRKVLGKCGVDLAGVTKVIVQNANPLLNAYVLSNAGVNTEKIFKDNFGRHGHLDCLDFLVNLKDSCENDSLAAGDLILSLGIGWAGTYASILFSKN